MDKSVDCIQQRITSYASNLKYDDLPPDVVRAAKSRIIDNLGALVCGFFSESGRVTREFAAQRPDANGATVLCTRIKTTPEMAAFVNGTAARYVELTDSYLGRSGVDSHPSDVVTPILAIAEHTQASGREFITSVVLAYEVYLGIAAGFYGPNFDSTNFTCVATAAAAGKLLGLSPSQLSSCIAMAATPNIILKQVRLGSRSIFKAAASGYAGHAGVFAALLARMGMDGPSMPFEGKAGWREQLAQGSFDLDALGGDGVGFRILETRDKTRPASRWVLSSILAAEKLGPLANPRDVERITVEVYKRGKDNSGTDQKHWNPTSRESADESAPYVVAAALLDGTVTLHSYNEAHLRNSDLRLLMQKVEVIANDEFTRAYEQSPDDHRTRVTVVTKDGERLMADSDGDICELSVSKSDKQMSDKFLGLTQDIFSARQANTCLDYLWRTEQLKCVAEIPAAFSFI